MTGLSVVVHTCQKCSKCVLSTDLRFLPFAVGVHSLFCLFHSIFNFSICHFLASDDSLQSTKFLLNTLSPLSEA